MMAVRKAPQECAPGMSLRCTYFPAPAFVYTLHIAALIMHSSTLAALLFSSTLVTLSNPVTDTLPHSFLFLSLSLLPLFLFCAVHRVHMYGVPPRSSSTAPHGRHTGKKVRTYVPPAMPCNVMSCHVMSCHVMSCHVMSCHVSCHVMSCHVMSCHVMSCHVMSCHVISCHVMSCHFMSCHVIYCPVVSYLASR
jgi:hypothetical protein